MRLVLALCTVVYSGCGSLTRCEKERDVAQAQGFSDGRACHYAPLDLPEQFCNNGSQEPTLVYTAAFCGTASLTCLATNREWAIVCFEPFDTSDTGAVVIRPESF